MAITKISRLLSRPMSHKNLPPLPFHATAALIICAIAVICCYSIHKEMPMEMEFDDNGARIKITPIEKADESEAVEGP